MAAPTAIIVDTDPDELGTTEAAFEDAGFVSKSAVSFEQARHLLGSIVPDIVIADVRLGAFNGLHLAALCAVSRPGTPFIATHRSHDSVLEADAQRLGAAYVIKTATRRELTRTASTLIDSRRRGLSAVRRSSRKAAPVETAAKLASADAEIVDVSYEGVQLKVASAHAQAQTEPPVAFDFLVPQLHLSLHAARVWSSQDIQSGSWLCGADVSGNGADQLQRWREFVDSV